jgi:hypothetical protein
MAHRFLIGLSIGLVFATLTVPLARAGEKYDGYKSGLPELRQIREYARTVSPYDGYKSGLPDLRRIRALRTERGVVDLEEILDLVQPSLFDEPHVVRVSVVARVGAGVCELHRDAEPELVLRADLLEDVERLDARNPAEGAGRLDEVAFGIRPGGMTEPERDGMTNTARLHVDGV